MADAKLSALPDSGALTGAEYLYIAQSATSYKQTLDNLASFILDGTFDANILFDGSRLEVAGGIAVLEQTTPDTSLAGSYFFTNASGNTVIQNRGGLTAFYDDDNLTASFNTSGLSFYNDATFASGTPSVGEGSGAVIISGTGGLGVGGAANIGGITKITNATAGGAGVGALVVSVGGASIAGAVNIGGALTIGAYTLPTADGTSGYVLKTNGAGVVTWQADVGSADPILATAGTVSAPSYSFATSTDSGLYLPSVGALGIAAGGVQALSASSTALTIPLSTTSTDSATGALVVTGGAGIGGALNVGGDIKLVGNTLTIGSQYRLIKAASNHLQFRSGAATANIITLQNSAAANNAVLSSDSVTGLTITTLGGKTAFGDSTASTSSTTGTLTVAGGVGIAGALYLGTKINAPIYESFNLYTDASNYEKMYMRWDADTFKISTESMGTPVTRAILIESADPLTDFKTGKGVTLRAGRYRTSTLIGEAAYVDVQGSNALNSGGSPGGNVVIKGGTGSGNQSAGGVQILGGDQIANGSFTVGEILIQGGKCNTFGSGSGTAGGAIRIVTQSGTTSTTAVAGAGGPISITLGDGSSSTQDGAGAGGAFSIIGGVGGDSAGTTTGNGGNGSTLTFTAGNGGNATGASGTRTGGDGGNIVLTAGTAGTGATANGATGTIQLNGAVVTSSTLTIGAYTLPATDGALGQTLSTDGNGEITWVDGVVIGTLGSVSILSAVVGEDGVAIGLSTSCGVGVSIGAHANATDRGTSIGAYSNAVDGIAIGFSATTTAVDGIAIGYGCTATDTGICIGSWATAEADSIAIGEYATAISGVLAIGNATTETINGMKFGDGSYTVNIVNPISTTSTVTIGAYTLPATDGTSGQVLKTDGAGTLTWQNP